jgi:hypothetical protein
MADANAAVNEALRPIAAIAVPAGDTLAGHNITLRADGSAAACGRTISSYSWTSSAGILADDNSAVVTLPAPSTPGVISLDLTVTDDGGRIDNASARLVTITDVTNPGNVITIVETDAPSSAGTSACLAPVKLNPLVTVTAADASAAEAGDTGAFTFTRSGDTSAAITVNFDVGGTASAGTDYTTLPTSVSIPAGQTAASLTVTPVSDTAPEGSETVLLALSGGTGYDIDTSTASVRIADNPPPPQPPSSKGGGGELDWISVLAALSAVVTRLARRSRIG